MHSPLAGESEKDFLVKGKKTLSVFYSIGTSAEKKELELSWILLFLYQNFNPLQSEKSEERATPYSLLAQRREGTVSSLRLKRRRDRSFVREEGGGGRDRVFGAREDHVALNGGEALHSSSQGKRRLFLFPSEDRACRAEDKLRGREGFHILERG